MSINVGPSSLRSPSTTSPRSASSTPTIFEHHIKGGLDYYSELPTRQPTPSQPLINPQVSRMLYTDVSPPSPQHPTRPQSTPQTPLMISQPVDTARSTYSFTPRTLKFMAVGAGSLFCTSATIIYVILNADTSWSTKAKVGYTILGGVIGAVSGAAGGFACSLSNP